MGEILVESSSRHTGRTEWALRAAAGLVLMLGASSPWLLPERPPLAVLVLALVVVACGPAVVRHVAARGREDPIDGAGFFALLCVLGYLIPLPAFLDERDAASTFLGYSYAGREQSLRVALATAVLSAVGFWIGWWGAAPVRRGPRTGAFRWDRRRLALVTVVYATIGLAAFALGVAAVGGPAALVEAQSDRLRAFAGINFLLYGAQLLPIAWLVHFRSRLEPGGAPFTPLMLIGGALALAPTLLLGTKVILFFTVGAAVLMHHRLRRPLGLTKIAMGGVLSVVLATGYDLIFREYLVNREITSIVLDNLTASEAAGIAIDRAVGSQFMQLQNLAVIVDAHRRELPPEHGRTFLPVFTQLVPRKLWAGKPTTPAGVFAEKLRPDLVENGTTFPPSFVGELYWNGGDLLVAVGMFLLGFTARHVERWRATGTPASAAVGAITVLMIPMLLRGDFSDTVTAWITLAAPTALAIKLASRQCDLNHTNPSGS